DDHGLAGRGAAAGPGGTGGHAPRALPAAREPVRGHVPRQPGHEPVAGRARRRHGAGRGRRSRDAAVVTGRGRRRRGLRGRRAAGGRGLGGRSGTRTRARSGGGGGADGQRDDRGARRGRYAGGGPRPRRPPLPARVDALVLGGARPCPLLLNPRRGAASVDVLTVDAAIAHHRNRSKLSIMVLTASSNRLEALRYLMREFESSSRRSSQGRSSAWGVGLPSRVSRDIEASVDWAR